MGDTLVSVIIPVYNGADMIGGAIASARMQKVPLEIIVVDDCSGDGLAQTMQKYDDDPSILYVRNEKNMGAAASRNLGVSLAHGEYVAFLDADDRWRADKLAKQLARIEAENSVLCCTARELLRPDGTPTGRVIPVKERITYRSLLRHNCINCSSVLARTDVMKRFPMEHEEAHEDYITWLRILKEYRFACAVNEPLLQYRLSKSGKSGSKGRSAVMTFKVYRCMGFGYARSLLCFCSYALHGVAKYTMAHFRHRAEGGA